MPECPGNRLGRITAAGRPIEPAPAGWRFRAAGLLLAGFIAFAASPSIAQEPAFEAALPDSIVITASRYPEEARYTGRRVAVWTARDIERMPVSSVDELLRSVAGVDVQSRGGFGVQSDFSIRGSGFNGVLLLLDGAPVNDPMTGHFLADLPVPLSEIARIEVLRGPAAAVYGPDALGGVIQLFTYAGLLDGEAEAGRLDGALRTGAHGLYDVDLRAARTVQAVQISAASAWLGTDGERIGGSDIRTDFRRRVHTAAASGRIGSARVFARMGWDDRDFGAFHFYTPFPSDTAREATSTWWAQARAQGRTWSAQVHAKQHHDRYVYNPITPANEHTSRLLNAYALRTWEAEGPLSFSMGAETGIRGIDSNNLGIHQDVSGGVFASTRWLRGAVAVRAAGHADYDPAYGVELTPQLFGSVTSGRLTFHGGAARAVRAPNYIERYFNTTLTSPRGRSLGNPDLRPERSWSMEAGASIGAPGGAQLHLTGFRRITRDLIDYAMTSPDDTVFLARNLHRVRTRGLEAELEVRRRIGDTVVGWTSAYTLLDADLGQLDDGVSFKYALTHARHLLQSALSAQRGRAEGALRAEYKDPIDGASYFVLHARTGYRRPLPEGDLTFSIELRNALDVEYADVFDAPMPGRWWIAGIRWRR